MAEVKKILEKKWEYTLYQMDEGYVISVMCGGVAMYELNVPVSSEEADEMRKDESVAQRIAARIRDNPSQYTHLHVKL